MHLRMFSVHDKAVNAFMSPFFAPTDAAAVRMLKDALNDPSSGFARHSGDYTLYCVGVFDDQSGVVAPQGPDRVIELIALQEPPAVS